MRGTEVGAMTAEVVWLALMHGTWLGLAAAAGAGMVLGGRWRLGPEGRCRVLWAAVLMAGIGPFGLAVAHREIARLASETGREIGVLVAVSEGEEKGSPVDETRPEQALAEVRRAADGGVSLLEAARPVLLAVWGTGFALAASVLAVGVVASLRIKAAGSVAPERAARIAGALARGLGMGRAPDVLVHSRVVEPGLHGFLRPAVLLPAGWVEAATDGEIAAVLAHELAHASRRDPVGNLVQRWLEALLFFHPAFRWLSASLRHQREHRADAVAVRLTGDPLALARALESFGRARRQPSRFGPIVPAFAGDSSQVLLNRIQEILGMMPQNRRFQLWPVVALPASFIFAVAAVMQPVLASGGEPTDKSQLLTIPFITLEGPQLSVEVHFLDLDPEAASILPVADSAASESKPFDVWSLSDLELLHLRSRVRALGDRARLVSAPKTSIFEGSTAIYAQADDGVSNDLRKPAPRMFVKVGGTYAKGRIHGHCLVSRDWPRMRPKRETMAQMSWDNPDGSNVILRPSHPTLGHVAGKQRFLLITMRHILTEEEEVVMGRPEAPAAP